MRTLGIAAAALMAASCSDLSTSEEAEAPAGVSAADPEAMARLLRSSGYETELTKDSYGDPLIETKFSGWPGRVVFYGCDEEAGTNCDSVALRVGFDRAQPMPLEMMDEEFGNDRFYAVYLDDEGDPWFTWDIVTGTEGIPTAVFMRSVNEFAGQIAKAADVVFAEERGGAS